MPIGWAVPITEPDRLLQLTVELSRATHRDPDAQVTACVVATCGSWALEGTGPRLLLEIARETAATAGRSLGGSGRLAAALGELAAGTWAAPAGGVSMDPSETVTAVLACVTEAPSLPEALTMAVRLGGDTDTVAALVGGLLGCQLSPTEVHAALPWSTRVNLPPAAEIADLAEGLVKLRTRAAS
jgi:ADP-ribosyl-[dinitrogen reductase] hydrolase